MRKTPASGQSTIISKLEIDLEDVSSELESLIKKNDLLEKKNEHLKIQFDHIQTMERPMQVESEI